MSRRRPSEKLSLLDRFLIGLAPRWGLRRVRARTTARAMLRSYEAASGGRRTDGWRRYDSDANRATGPALQELREISRDLRRNNVWAKRAISVISSNTVGWGIRPRPTENRETAAAIWKLWSESPACDFDGRLPFTGLQSLVMDAVVEGGEALIRYEPASLEDDLVIPIRVRVLEADYLDSSKDGPLAGGRGRITQGIELDGRGRRVAYHLHRQHPGGSDDFALGYGSVRVPAEEIDHVYRVDRPGQRRGVPWLVTAITKLHGLDDYEDAALVQKRIAACFGAFVQDLDGQPLGGIFGDGSSSITAESEDADILEELEPGQIQYLPPGKTVSFATPPQSPDHVPFTQGNLRGIAAGLDVTYEEMTGDYSQVNYSSARMARLSHWRSVESWRENILIPHVCAGAWRRVMGLAAEMFDWDGVPGAEWSAAPMPMLDPEKEGRAASNLIRSGVRSLYQVIAELGEDPEAHLDEIQRGNRALDERGIVLDSDPRRVTQGGQMQALKPAPEAATNGSGSPRDDEDDEIDADEDGDARPSMQ